MKVLIADDDHLTREGIAKYIDWNSYNLTLVPSAENGRIALERIEQYNIDILITDIRMPFLSGFELISAANSKGFFPATIIISGYDDKEYLQQAIKLNIIVSYIFKPLNLSQLNRAILDTITFRNTWKRTIVLPDITSNIYIDEFHIIESFHKVLFHDSLENTLSNFSLLWNNLLQSHLDLNYLKRFCWEFIVSTFQNATKLGLNTHSLFLNKDPLLEITHLSDPLRLYEYMVVFLQQIKQYLNIPAHTQSVYADYAFQAIFNQYSNPNLSIQLLASQLGITANYLSFLYKKQYGSSFSTDLIKTRMDNAKQLLCLSKLKIKDIALNVGFNDSKYFTIVFKNYTGLTPKAFRSKFNSCSNIP